MTFTAYRSVELRPTLMRLSEVRMGRLLKGVLGLDEDQVAAGELRGGQALVLWLACQLPELVSGHDEQDLVLETFADKVCEHGDGVDRAITHGAASMPVAALSVGGKRWVRMSGESTHLDLRTGARSERAPPPQVLTMVCDLTALYCVGRKAILTAREKAQ